MSINGCSCYAVERPQIDLSNIADCDGINNLLSNVSNGNLRIQKVRIGNSFSVNFINRNGKIIFRGKQIPNSGHYDYALFNQKGKFIGGVKILVGIHYYNICGEEVAWDRPQGYEKHPGTRNIKTLKAKTIMRNIPPMEMDHFINRQSSPR